MEIYLPIIRNCVLFKGIAEAELVCILRCLNTEIVSFEKNADIFDCQPIKIGILLSGNLQNIQIDFLGNQNIIANFLPGDLFGEALVCANLKISPVNIVAPEQSKVMFLDYSKILNVCNNTCSFHVTLLRNMLRKIYFLIKN